MKMAELSTQTGVPVATLKYYLREGLVPPGEALGATRAEYDGSHVDRVRLVRALVDGAGLSIAAVHAIVTAIEHPPTSRHELLGVAQHLLPTKHPEAEVTGEVRDLVHAAGWTSVYDDGPALHMLAGAIAAARASGIPLRTESLLAYAAASDQVAAVDLGQVRDRTPAQALLTVAAGTVLVDVVLAAMRRLAQESLSARAAGSPG